MVASRHIFASCILLALVPLLACSQESKFPIGVPAPAPPSFDNSADGLRLELHGIWVAGRDRDSANVDSFIKQLEIPNYKDWFTNVYGETEGESWAGNYAQDLAARERDLAAFFLQIGATIGQLEIREVNEAPNPGVEAALVNGQQHSTEIFYATWNQKQPAATIAVVGYFAYVDGRFRWDSTVLGLKIRAKNSANGAAAGGTPQGDPIAGLGGNSSNGIPTGPYRPPVSEEFPIQPASIAPIRITPRKRASITCREP